MLDHIFLTVSNIDRSIAFYERVLPILSITARLDYDGKDGPPGHPDLKGFGANGRMFFWLRQGHPAPGAVHIGLVAISPTMVPSPLSGFLEDGLGRPMRPVHANKGSRRYRYYLSQASVEHAEAAWRIPARDLEDMIQRSLSSFLTDSLRLSSTLGAAAKSSDGLEMAGGKLVQMLDNTTSFSRLLGGLGARIIVRLEAISILIDPSKLLGLLGCGVSPSSGELINLDIEVKMRRRGHELKLIYAAPEARAAMRDDRLIQLLGQGRIAYQQLLSKPMKGTARSHAVRMARLNFLAPDIVTAILEGRQPVELNTRALLRSELPIAWKEQRRVLGFD